jgi:hypothetical protein
MENQDTGAVHCKGRIRQNAMCRPRSVGAGNMKEDYDCYCSLYSNQVKGKEEQRWLTHTVRKEKEAEG